MVFQHFNFLFQLLYFFLWVFFSKYLYPAKTEIFVIIFLQFYGRPRTAISKTRKLIPVIHYWIWAKLFTNFIVNKNDSSC